MRTHLYKFIFIVISLCALATTNAWAKYLYIEVTELRGKSAPSDSYKDYTGDYYIEHLRVHTNGSMGNKTIDLDKNSLLTINGRKLYKVEIDDRTTTWQISTIDKNNASSKFYHPSGTIAYQTDITYNNKYIIREVQWVQDNVNTGEVVHMIGIVTGGLIYFDNSKTNWSAPIQMVIGHGSYARTYNLKQIDGTALWYVNLDKKDAEWADATYFAFINTEKAHILEKTTPENAVLINGVNNTDIYRTPTELFKGDKYIFKPDSAKDKTTMTCTQAAPTKFNITQKVKIRDYEGANYQEITSNFPATFTLTTHTLNTGDTTAVAETKTGTSTLISQSVYKGRTTFSFSYTNPNETNFKFDAWGTGGPSASATNTSYANNYDKATTMYAFFTRKYAFSFSAQTGGTMTTKVGTTTLSSGTRVVGDTITLTASPNNGYEFSKWVDANGTELSTSTTYKHILNADITIKAVFAPKTYTITFDRQGGTGGTGSITATYLEIVPNITKPTRTGYTFGGYWTVTNGNFDTQYYNQSGGAYYNRKYDKTQDITLYAKWTANKYTVKFDGNGNTSGSMADQSFIYDVAQNLTANAFSRTGYTFAGWNTKKDGTGTLYSDGESVINLNSTSDGQITVYAQWTANKYTITLNANGGSGNTASVQATYASATLPEITNPTRTGYTFKGWYSAANGGTLVISTKGQLQASKLGFTDENKKWIATENKNLYAQWTANTYSVIFNANGGNGTMANQQFTYDVEQALSANQFTRVGYTFAGWNNDASGSSTSYSDQQSVKNLNSTQGGTRILYAQWTCVAPTNVNISGNYIVFPGETIELTVSGNNIAADATYVWKKGDQVIPGQTTATLTIPNCVAANAGNYSCTVTNGTCSASNNYTIKMYRLRGLTDPIDNWTTDFVFTKAEGKTATYLMDLNGSSSYQFKVHDGEAYYGNQGDNPTMTSTNCTGWEMVQNLGRNVTLNTTLSGKYIFTLDYTNEARPTISVTYPSKKTIYLNPNNIWNADNPKYLIHAWIDGIGNQTNILMEKLNDCNANRTIYKAEIVGTYDRIIFVRCNPDISDVNQIWDKKWNQTNTLWLNVAENQFDISSINGGYEGVSTGEWSDFIPYYTISYDITTNEVEPMENVCLMDGSAWTAPTDPERIGYTFLGWRRPANTNDDTLYKYGQSFTPKADEQLTAQWQLNEYTVIWKVDREVCMTNIVSVESPLMENIPQNPADNALGCCADKFMGWSTSANPKESDVFDASMPQELPSITQNTTFHAVFATRTPGVGTSTLNFGDMGYADKETVSSVTLGDGQGSGDATITLAQSASLRNDPKYYIIGNALRAYAGNTITINATYSNTVIRKVTFTFGDGDGTNEITANSGTYVDGIWTENVESPTNNLILTIGGSTGHRRIASIEVTVGINGNEYINYVTTCPNLGTPTLGDVSIDKHQIDVRCNTISSMKSAAKITFPNAADLTCPITVTASDGFLISTDQNASAKYASSLTIWPKKSGDDKGKIAKNIYVRADATQQTVPYSGTITILKTEGEEETKTISITANVNCQQYVFKTVDHLGRAISTTNYYADQIIDEKPADPTSDDCSIKYTFDGWSRTPIAYGAPVYDKVTFPFVMPAEDVTLYPVYICNSDYHRVTSDLGDNNWAGDYLIAYSDKIFADGRLGGTGDAAIGKANVQAEDFSDYIKNDVVPASYGNTYYITLESVEGGYVLKTQDGRYNYIRNAETSGLVDASGKNTAAIYPLTISFDEESHNVSIANLQTTNKAELRYTGSRFGFYDPTKYNPIYLYKKYLYTSSLICEEITAEDAMVTSTAGQTIKVNVTATMSNMTVVRDRELTVKSDNSDFDATIVPTTNANEYNVAVCYKPKDNTDGTETANITIKVNNNPVTTFQVTGRHLPADFVIAAKWGDNWYALPANIASDSSKDGLLIEVDDPADPTKAIAAPHTTKYGLKSVYTSNSTGDRFSDYGERLVFVENISGQSNTLYNGGGSGTSNTNIQVNAQYTGYYDKNPDRYEWLPTTDDLQDYLLTSANAFLDERARTISLDVHGEFGTLLKDMSYNGYVRLLPVDNFYQPIELQIVEWKQNSVSVMYTGAGTHYITQVGNNIASGELSESTRIDHAVYSLSTTDLTTATNQPLTITIKDGETTIGAITITIPAIVVGEKNSTSLVTNNDIAKATSVVILDGATLTADATKYTYDDMVVYPGGKLVINNGGQLGMYTLTLRLGSSWGATEYEHKYPEFVLNTTADGAYTNTSGKINLDYVTTKEQYYTFVAPFAVNTKTIKYPVDIYGSNVKADNTGSFEFQYYDGAARAAGNTGWTVVEEDPTNGATLNAGQGYTFLGMPKKVSVNGGSLTRQTYGIHRIPMSISAANVMKHENETQTVPVASNPSIKNNNSSWNLIGNPYMQLVNGLDNDAIQVGQLVHSIDVNGKWTGGWHWDDQVNGQRFLVFPSNDGLSYEAQQSKNALLPAFKNFFVQIGVDNISAMSIPVPNAQGQPALQAPAYHDGEAIETDVEVAIVLEQDEKHTDQLDLLINKVYTADFDRDADFTKMMNATQLNLFGVHWDNLSFIAIDQQTAQQSIPIGYQVPDAGEYTLRMSDKPYLMWDKIEALYLTDHEMEPEVTTDIMQQPYLFHVGKAETNHTRFTLSIIRKAESENQTPTHIDTQVAERKWSCKFIYQNKIYILHDGVIYDMMGKQIRTINK